MEITKNHHESGCGIYAKSATLTEQEIKTTGKEVADQMIAWLDATNGEFAGEFKRAFAMAHCQVVDHDHPIKLFVVDKDMVVPKDLPEKSEQTLANYFFEAQAIFNCEILEASEKVSRKVPQRKVTTDKNDKSKVEVGIEMVDKEIPNTIEVPEGCMSFPNRKERNMKRYYTIKVRYQYLKKGLLGTKVETFEGWVEGLKAHIIQHETDHFDGKNIHFKS